MGSTPAVPLNLSDLEDISKHHWCRLFHLVEDINQRFRFWLNCCVLNPEKIPPNQDLLLFGIISQSGKLLGTRSTVTFSEGFMEARTSHPCRNIRNVPLRPDRTILLTSASLTLGAQLSLQLWDLQGWGTGDIQKEGSFLFGQEGGWGDVVDACWDVVQLHVAETTSGDKRRKVSSHWTEQYF